MLQVGAVIGHWFECVHWTHAVMPFWLLQKGVGALQSESIKQTTHCPRFVSHSGAADEQSLFWRHATHVLVVVLQSGAPPLHCPLLVHPERHVKSCGLQICDAPQSELARHCTHE